MLVSGRPDNIDAFAEAGGGVARLVQEEAAELGGALEAFRATEGWSEYLGDVPPLDIDLGAAGGMVALASRAGTFAGDLRAADLLSVDGITYAAGLFAAWDDLGEVASAPVLVQDGDRWILAGTVDADHVRLQRSADGSYEAVVTTVRPDGSTVTHTVAITAEQAGDLVIHVGAGNDVIEVPAGAELSIVMWGGDGDDLLGAGREGPLAGVGGGGDDTIFGGAGDDVVYAGGGDDAVYGGEGTDDLDGQDGDDTIAGGDGQDQVHGGRGDDSIIGGRGDDSLDGGSGRDDVDGGAGDDVVVGGRGEDVVAGGAGDDRLLGGRDHDVIVGGSGDDTATMEDGELGIVVETRVTLALTGSPGDYAIELVPPDWLTGAEWDAYLERIDSDLEFIRSTEVGRQGLTALDNAARDSDSGWKPGDRDRRVRIYPYGDDDQPMVIDPDGSAGPEPERVYTALDWMSGRTNPQASYASRPGNALEHDGLISYSQARPGIYDSFLPAAAVLYHELAHSHDHISGGNPGGTYEEHWFDAAATRSTTHLAYRTASSRTPNGTRSATTSTATAPSTPSRPAEAGSTPVP